MGNNNSTVNNDWDSDDEGGSDYEHTYHFHTSVLDKSPADGFESDYEPEDDDDVRHGGGRKKRTSAPKPVSDVVLTSATPLDGGEGGDDIESTADASCLGGNKVNTDSHKRQANSQPGCSDELSHSSERYVRGHNTRLGMNNAEPSEPKRGEEGDGGGDKRLKPDAQPGHTGRKQDTVSINNAHSTATSRGTQHTQIAQTGDVSQKRTSQRSTAQQNAAENEETEVYETAGEGSGGEDKRVDVSDDDSFSTITPPRTRPQSDSDFSVIVESASEEEAEDDEDDDEETTASDTSDNDTVTERIPSRSSRSSPRTAQQQRSPKSQVTLRSSPRSVGSSSRQQSQQSVPRRQGMSQDSYHQARKRPASPTHGLPAKRSRPSDGISFSPNRTRFGVFDTESESDTRDQSRRGRKRRAAEPPPPPPPQRNLRETRALSSRTLRQAAKKAASQFMKTSRKFLQNAAVHILKETTSKRRTTVQDHEEEDFIRGRGQASMGRETRSSRRAAEARREERLSFSKEAALPSTRRNRGGLKRKAEDENVNTRVRNHTDDHFDLEMEEMRANNESDSWRQIRKDGGRLRKFTRSATVTASPVAAEQSLPQPSPSYTANIRSCSVPLFDAAQSDRLRVSPESVSKSSTKKTNSPQTTSNPFQNVSLLPPSIPLSTSTGSVDSISGELLPPPTSSPGPDPSPQSPFHTLAVAFRRVVTPPLLNFTSGSIWARINTRVNQQSLDLTNPPSESQPSDHRSHLAANQQSPMPGTSGSRMATRNSPQLVPQLSPSASYPARSTPRVPSLTLTGQFAQSGRFAFLLEDVLQVTVTTTEITRATTSAVVISTDSQLHHQNLLAQRVAQAAGAGFAQVCQDYLRHHAAGLQVCEVLDTPAGGRLSPLISHVLHVVVPELESAGDISKHKKLLLCTYLNCLKHTSEKLRLSSVAFPLIGADKYTADECIQVFFDSLLVYLAERTPTCPLHAIHLIVNNPAIGRFAAEVLEVRLEAMLVGGVDAAMASVFREYFNIPDFSRSSTSAAAVARSPSGKPAVKRRRL